MTTTIQNGESLDVPDITEGTYEDGRLTLEEEGLQVVLTRTS
jgi:hypothetical protein